MAKSLSARIAARRSQDQRRGKHRAEFLGVREQVGKALADGWPMLAIWETLRVEGKISAGYESFRRYVKRLVVDQAAKRGWNDDIRKKTKEATRGKPATAGLRQQLEKSTTGKRGFDDYNSVPNEEELF